MFLKIALSLFILLLVDASEVRLPKQPPLLKTFHSDYFDRIDEVPEANINVTGSATVLKSNLPVAMQSRLASALTVIYQSYSDELQRAQQFQSTCARIYPVYWNVVTNFDVITFYSQYYILLQINSDRVLAFGLQ